MRLRGLPDYIGRPSVHDMRSEQSISRIGLSACLAMLLGCALLVTPQTVGWLTQVAWAELGLNAPPLLEEEVKHTERLVPVDAELTSSNSRVPGFQRAPADEDFECRALGRVPVPPPEA
jgi:hypothetical protein